MTVFLTYKLFATQNLLLWAEVVNKQENLSSIPCSRKFKCGIAKMEITIITFLI